MQWCHSYHWSLIVICYFGQVASYEDAEDNKTAQIPCILHMDSLRGNHLGLKDLIQSYLREEWKERQKQTCGDLCAKFRNLKFIPLELPQQQNSYDCGLFLLHYIELFLEEVPANFSIHKITPSSKFLQADWFPPGEASMKRAHIERLINALLKTHSERCSTSGGRGMSSSPDCPNKTTNDYQNFAKFSVKYGPLYPHKSSQCDVGQGNEMTLSPALSKRSNHYTRTAEFYSDELFEQASTSKTLGDTPCKTLGIKASSCGFITEEGLETIEPFVPKKSAEPAFHHLDSIMPPLAPETHTFHASCRDFPREPAHQSAPLIDTSPMASGEQHNAEESLNQVRISDRTCGPGFLKNLVDIEPKVNQLQASHSSAFVYDVKSVVKESEHPTNMFNFHDQGHSHTVTSRYPPVQSREGKNFIDHESMTEPSKQHMAKRIRIMPQDGLEEPTSRISEHLNI